MSDAADDAKRQRVGDAKEKPDDVEEAFNKVELYVSRYTDYAAGKFDEVKFSRWTPDSDDYDDDAPITEEELNLVAYAHPTIYFKELGSNGGLRDWPSGVKFDAPNGQDHFKVRDLVRRHRALRPLPLGRGHSRVLRGHQPRPRRGAHVHTGLRLVSAKLEKSVPVRDASPLKIGDAR